MSNGCDERGACEKFILHVASLLDYSDRLLAKSACYSDRLLVLVIIFGVDCEALKLGGIGDDDRLPVDGHAERLQLRQGA